MDGVPRDITELRYSAQLEPKERLKQDQLLAPCFTSNRPINTFRWRLLGYVSVLLDGLAWFGAWMLVGTTRTPESRRARRVVTWSPKRRPGFRLRARSFIPFVATTTSGQRKSEEK